MKGGECTSQGMTAADAQKLKDNSGREREKSIFLLPAQSHFCEAGVKVGKKVPISFNPDGGGGGEINFSLLSLSFTSSLALSLFLAAAVEKNGVKEEGSLPPKRCPGGGETTKEGVARRTISIID